MVYACYAFAEYLNKSVLPFKLSYLYPFPSLADEPLPRWLLLYPPLLAVLFFAFWKQIVTQRIWVFCLLYFLIHIAVALHIISLSRFAVVADRYAYIATIGACFPIAYYGIHFTKKWKGTKKMALVVALSACLLYFGVYANIRSRVWHDSDSLKKELRELIQKKNEYEERHNSG